MRTLTEKAFRDSDHAARLLGDMKHGINEVKTAGGIDEKQKLEALMGFRTQAEDILKKMGDSIGTAIYGIDQEVKTDGVDNSNPNSSGGFAPFCMGCGQRHPAHGADCPFPVDVSRRG